MATGAGDFSAAPAGAGDFSAAPAGAGDFSAAPAGAGDFSAAPAGAGDEMPLNLSNRDQNSGHNDPQNVKVFGRTSAAQLPPGRGLLVANDGVMEGVLIGTPQ